jgi:structural maintenance of chromosome 2
MKCVTVDGDVHDPSGTLTGGYVNQNNMLLPRRQRLQELETLRDDLRRRQREAQDRLDSKKSDAEYHQGLLQDM